MAENISQADNQRHEGNRRDDSRRGGERPNANRGERKDDYPSKEIEGQQKKPDLEKKGVKDDYPAKEVGGKEPGGGRTEANTSGRDMEPEGRKEDTEFSERGAERGTGPDSD